MTFNRRRFSLTIGASTVLLELAHWTGLACQAGLEGGLTSFQINWLAL